MICEYSKPLPQTVEDVLLISAEVSKNVVVVLEETKNSTLIQGNKQTAFPRKF